MPRILLARILLACLITVVTCAGASAQVLYSNNLDSPNAGGTGRYGFDGVHTNNGQWSVTHLATGGWQGSGAAQVTLNAGQSQYMLGWWTPSFGWTPATGDSVFIRLRMRWPSGQPASRRFGVKLILFGTISDGSDSTSRVITFLGTSGASACALDQGTSAYGGGYQEHHKPSDYGVNLSGNQWTGNYVGLAVNRNIEGPGACAVPPILMTSFNNHEPRHARIQPQRIRNGRGRARGRRVVSHSDRGEERLARKRVLQAVGEQ